MSDMNRRWLISG